MNPALRYVSCHAWALTPPVFDGLMQIVERHESRPRADDSDSADAAPEFTKPPEPEMVVTAYGTAIIPVRGVIARYADQVNDICQDTGRSADSLQADIAKAAADPNVQRIVLRIDSPGGTVAGTAETAQAIAAAGKPTFAYVDGFAASAAYWLASQCDEIICSAETAEVGSIGVIMAYVDATAAQAAKGYKVNVMRSTALKAPGTANEALVPEQIAAIQRTLADLHAAFAVAVGAGRGLSEAEQAKVATGEVFVAARAGDLGLIDSIETWTGFLARVENTFGATSDPVRAWTRGGAGGAPMAVDAIDIRGEALVTLATLSAEALAPASSLTQPAAAGADPESVMDPKVLAALSALSAAHPTHAAGLIAEATKPGASADGLKAYVERAENEAKAKAAHDKLVSDLTAATARADAEKARADAAEAKATAAETARAEAQAKHDAIAGLKPQHKNPQPGNPTATSLKTPMSEAEFQNLGAIAQAKILAAVEKGEAELAFDPSKPAAVATTTQA